MIPILLCSAVSMAIILERFWTLRGKVVTPPELMNQTWDWARNRKLDSNHMEALRHNSPLGRVLASALSQRDRSRDIIKEAVEDTGRHVVHEMERFLNTLGTIAGISPLIGLLGTVVGMIKVFSAIVAHGVGNPAQLATGISEALITTGAGLCVAIPSILFYRHFRGRVQTLVIRMEQQAIKLVDTIDQSNTTPAKTKPAVRRGK